MAEYSKEWVEQEGNGMVPEFSIKRQFKKLKEGESKSIICEGFGITKIINDDDVCYIEIKGKVISYEDLTGEKLEKKDSYRSLIILFVLVSALWFLAWILIVNYIPVNNTAGNMSRGTFGDMFGSVNSLFSGLALSGIIFTIFLQRKELKLQRKELKETRKEFEIQNETLRLQRFENTFFQLINLHQGIVGKFTYENFKSRSVIKEARETLQNSFTLQHINGCDIEEAEEDMLFGYNMFYFGHHGYENTLSHYFRNLYHIFKYIYKSELISPENKIFYASIVRAQLSSDELILVLYNCLIEDLGKPNFLFFIKEFDILQNLNFSLIEHDYHKEIFDREIKNVKNPF